MCGLGLVDARITSAMPALNRIANIVGLGGAAAGYDVPAYAVGDGFSTELVETVAPVNVANERETRLADLNYTEAALRAVDAGCVAVILNTASDYGIGLVRAAVTAPVVGGGQASYQLAAGLGERFAIVTIWPPATSGNYERLLRNYGFAGRCSGVRFVTENSEFASIGLDSEIVAEMRAGRDSIIARITRVSEIAIADGADVIVLGCTSMSPLRAELESRVGRPVVDPLAAAHKLAEAHVALALQHASAMIVPDRWLVRNA
jgi:allantoin racemase